MVWLVFLPFLFLYFLFKGFLFSVFTRKWQNPIGIWNKISWIRQSVYEKMVLEKIVNHD